MSPSLPQINEDQKGEQSNSYNQADFLSAMANQQRAPDHQYDFNFRTDDNGQPPASTRQFSMGTRNDLDLTNQLSLNTTDVALKY